IHLYTTDRLRFIPGDDVLDEVADEDVNDDVVVGFVFACET
ncbi:unnamed protein product, partial [Didymodactylos carnosus]